MVVVRQAHMPGNYELYEPSTNRLGPVICRVCWEGFGRRNPMSLSTVWVSFEGRGMVWWLCQDHLRAAQKDDSGRTVFVGSEEGVVQSPGIRLP